MCFICTVCFAGFRPSKAKGVVQWTVEPGVTFDSITLPCKLLLTAIVIVFNSLYSDGGAECCNESMTRSVKSDVPIWCPIYRMA
jgi:hypothetical protein